MPRQPEPIPDEMAAACDLGVVIAAGGSGSRFGAGRDKLLEPLSGKPVFLHFLERTLAVLPPAHVVLVVSPGREPVFRAAITAAGLSRVPCFVTGGAQRQDSVANGLAALPAAVKIVAVQDAARPHSSLELLAACVASARLRGSGVAARRVTDTIKTAAPDGRVLETPPRDTLWTAETPQVFRRDLLERAYASLRASGTSVTDDAQAVELLGEPVFLVESQPGNRKITFPDDLEDER